MVCIACVSLTDADLLGRYHGSVDVLRDAGARERSSADREDEVVAVGVGERPVLGVTGVTGTLEGQRQNPVLIGHCRILHVLDGFPSWRSVSAIACPSMHRDPLCCFVQLKVASEINFHRVCIF